MNIGKSIKVALAKHDMKQNQLAERLGRSSSWLNQLANNPEATASTIRLLAGAFGMKASEFVALGEE